MNQYHALIIGFGKAGKTRFVTLAKAGWCVAVIEKSSTMYGGTCINIGCIPTKTLEYGAELSHDFDTAIRRISSVVGILSDKTFYKLADNDNVNVIEGHAEFIDKHTEQVLQPDGLRWETGVEQ